MGEARRASDPARSWRRGVRSSIGLAVVVVLGSAAVVSRLAGGAAATGVDVPVPGTDRALAAASAPTPTVPPTAEAPTTTVPTTSTTTVVVPEPTLPPPTVPAVAPTTVPPTWPAPPPTVRRIGVAVVGDSLVAQAIDDVLATLLASGWNGDIFGHAGMAIDAPSILGAAEAAASDPEIDVAVLATASNDNVANAARADEVGAAGALAEYRARLEERVARFGDRCVVLVDMREGAHELYRSAFSPATNAELASFAASRPNVVVVPWSAISRGHGDDWFLADGLHFSDAYGDRPVTDDRPAGRAAYAVAIAAGVDRCP